MSAVLDRFEQQDRERAAAQVLLAKLFAQAVQRGDVNAPALFARRRTSNPTTRTVADVIEDAITYRDFASRAMQILVNAANGRGTQRDAQQLLEEAGAHWADSEADFV